MFNHCAVLVLACFAASANVLAHPAEMPPEPAGSSYLVYVSTYTVRESKGIYVYRFHGGRLTPLGTGGLAAETVNPSFVAVDPGSRYLYAVNETETFKGQRTGAVSAFAINRANGKLTFLNQMPSGGTDPCFVSVDHTGKWVLVANYTSGSISVFPVLSGGRLGPASAFVQHHGHSVNPQRQEGPHAHQILLSPDNRFALVSDLGLDRLLVYRFDPTHGTLAPAAQPFAEVSGGSGPRHFAFDPAGRFVYLLSEVRSTITTFAYDPVSGGLHELGTVSSLPAGFSGPSDAAEIVMGRSGRFLYASNRGADTLAVFAIDPKTHLLVPVANVPSLGKTPRGFGIDPSGRFLLAANQDTDNLFVLSINPRTGELKPTGQAVEVPSPVSVAFVPAR